MVWGGRHGRRLLQAGQRQGAGQVLQGPRPLPCQGTNFINYLLKKKDVCLLAVESVVLKCVSNSQDLDADFFICVF